MAPIGIEFQPGHRLVSSAMLPDVIVECPHCHSRDFSIMGRFCRSFTQVYENGIAKNDAFVMGEIATRELEGIVCKTCGIHTLVEDELVFERESLIFDLYEKIAFLQGKTPAPKEEETNKETKTKTKTKDWVN